MKTLKDLKFSANNFLSKKDKLNILAYINLYEPALTSGDFLIGREVKLYRDKTLLIIHIIGAGMFKISKTVDKGKNYLYTCTVNFRVI